MSLRSREAAYRETLERILRIARGDDGFREKHGVESALSAIAYGAWETLYDESCDESEEAEARRVHLRGMMKRREIPPHVRDFLLERDQWHCGLCDEEIEDESDLHIDHIIPLSHGGSDDPDNLQPAHKRCNLSKGARVPG